MVSKEKRESMRERERERERERQLRLERKRECTKNTLDKCDREKMREQ